MSCGLMFTDGSDLIDNLQPLLQHIFIPGSQIEEEASGIGYLNLP